MSSSHIRKPILTFTHLERIINRAECLSIFIMFRLIDWVNVESIGSVWKVSMADYGTEDVGVVFQE